MRRRLFEQVAPRHGVVVPADLRAAGVSDSTFHEWRARERLDRPHHAVTLLPGAPDVPERRLAAAVAGIGPACAVTGWAAAYLAGVRTAAPTVVDILAPHGASHRRHAGIRVVETCVYDQVRVSLVRGVPCVSPDRWLADLARDTRLDVLVAIAIELRGTGQLGRRTLDDQLALRSRFPGRRRFRALAQQLHDDGSDSGFELRTRQRLEARGTPPDRGQLEVVVAGRRRRIDLPFADTRTGIECRGLAYHGRSAFDRDADRHNDFVEDGRWRLLELTWTQFLLDWDGFCARLDRLLARPD